MVIFQVNDSIKRRFDRLLEKKGIFAMIYSAEVQNMCTVGKGAYHGPAPIPEEGNINCKPFKRLFRSTDYHFKNLTVVDKTNSAPVRELALAVFPGLFFVCH